MSSMRPSSGSAVTSALGSGWILTSKLPTACCISVSGNFEVRVLNEAKHIAPGIHDIGGEDVVAHIPHIGARLRSELEQARIGRANVLHTPIGTRRHLLRIGGEPQLKTRDIETHIEGLIEIGPLPEDFCVPALAFGNVRRVVDGGAQT